MPFSETKSQRLIRSAKFNPLTIPGISVLFLVSDPQISPRQQSTVRRRSIQPMNGSRPHKHGLLATVGEIAPLFFLKKRKKFAFPNSGPSQSAILPHYFKSAPPTRQPLKVMQNILLGTFIPRICRNQPEPGINPQKIGPSPPDCKPIHFNISNNCSVCIVVCRKKRNRHGRRQDL